MIYKSEDGKVSFESIEAAHGRPVISMVDFNRAMEARGCPVRSEDPYDAMIVMFAAWDWLACKVEKIEAQQKIDAEK